MSSRKDRDRNSRRRSPSPSPDRQRHHKKNRDNERTRDKDFEKPKNDNGRDYYNNKSNRNERERDKDKQQSRREPHRKQDRGDGSFDQDRSQRHDRSAAVVERRPSQRNDREFQREREKPNDFKDQGTTNSTFTAPPETNRKREFENRNANKRAQNFTGLKSNFDFGKYQSMYDNHNQTGSSQANTGDLSSSGKKIKKNRWGSTDNDKVVIPGIPLTMPQNLTAEQEKIYLLQLEIEELSRKLRTNDLGISTNPAERSPSPEPLYNNEGIRTNTRDVRVKARLDMRRHEQVLKMLALNPEYRPPPDYRPPTIRFNDKVFLPQDEHPDINFVGLLIGPRGSTLKLLEKETGAKIIIRGKGSVKEARASGAKHDGFSYPGQDEPLHAWLTAPTEEILAGARKRIQEVIQQGIEIPDQDNDLRRQQLRELALINGTLQENDGLAKLRVLSEIQSIATNNVICGLCGGTGHLAIDCKKRREFDTSHAPHHEALEEHLVEEPVPPGLNMCTSIVRIGAGSGVASADRRKMDSEYTALMRELNVADGATAATFVDPTLSKIRLPSGMTPFAVPRTPMTTVRTSFQATPHHPGIPPVMQPLPPGLAHLSSAPPPPPPPQRFMGVGLPPPPPPPPMLARPPRPPAPPGFPPAWQPPAPPAPPQMPPTFL